MARECPPGAMRGLLGGGQVDLRMVYHIGRDGALERPRGGHDMAHPKEFRGVKVGTRAGKVYVWRES